MSDSIIKLEGIGKKYRVHHQRREHYSTLRDAISEKVRNVFRSRLVDTETNSAVEDFWALKDISFEVQRGEVVGIIGRNGAGKSTLLKILSRITEPTLGRAEIDGRVASLLEVGTGFHPELTGRENIFLNGAILGMSRAEINRKFDEIVAFAEIDKFLDTPVKRYSSGMYVRLAFAIAAHMEPEILIVDEVLAVGDMAFQEKCIGKMNSVAKTSGRTVLFVSHNISAIQRLCARAILISSGGVSADGPTDTVIGGYLSDARIGNRINLADWEDRTTSGEARIIELEIGDGSEGGTIAFGGNLSIKIHAQFDTALVDPTFGILVNDSGGAPLLDIRSNHDGLHLGRVLGNIIVELNIPSLGLYPGRYLLSPWIADSACQRDVDFPRLCATLIVRPAAESHVDLKLDPIWGKYFVRSHWN